MKLLIAGDIGGTKTSLGLFSLQGGPRNPLREGTFRSAGYESLEDVCAEFTDIGDKAARFGVFGVAGPVSGTKAKLTNLPWIIDADRVSSTLSLDKTVLINDLEAIAWGIDLLEEEDFFRLSQPGAVNNPQGARAVIAPGTGLGQAFMTWDGSRYRVHPSEGGHASFAPGNEREAALLLYLRKRFAHVSWEHVCSGSGIANIYEFLRDEGHCEEPGRFADKLKNSEDRAALILTTAVNEDNAPEICGETLNMFLSVLGNQAGNLALTVMATGGIYIGGGIMPRIVNHIAGSPFLKTFLNKGRFSSILADIPISVILNPKVALMGAARLGLELMKKSQAGI
ncbi:MAG: glucokinase [Syntrophales bacterium]|nr:glucokinase [Syntrophales bacterium]